MKRWVWCPDNNQSLLGAISDRDSIWLDYEFNVLFAGLVSYLVIAPTTCGHKSSGLFVWTGGLYHILLQWCAPERLAYVKVGEHR